MCYFLLRVLFVLSGRPYFPRCTIYFIPFYLLVICLVFSFRKQHNLALHLSCCYMHASDQMKVSKKNEQNICVRENRLFAHCTVDTI